MTRRSLLLLPLAISGLPALLTQDPPSPEERKYAAEAKRTLKHIRPQHTWVFDGPLKASLVEISTQ